MYWNRWVVFVAACLLQVSVLYSSMGLPCMLMAKEEAWR